MSNSYSLCHRIIFKIFCQNFCQTLLFYVQYFEPIARISIISLYTKNQMIIKFQNNKNSVCQSIQYQISEKKIQSILRNIIIDINFINHIC